MIEILCEDHYGTLHHGGVLGIEVPRFRTEEQAERWCNSIGWKARGKDGRPYTLYIHEVVDNNSRREREEPNG